MRKLMIAGTRLFLGAIFCSSGMAKLTHGDFIGIIGPVWLEQRIAPYGLALWAQFVAWSQVVIGLLLLSQRFATLGALMLVPMLANILVVTISLQWRGTPWVNSILLLMNLFLLLSDWPRLRPLLSDLPEAPAPILRPENRPANALAIAGIAVGAAGPLLYAVDRWMTFSCAIAAIVLFALGALRGKPWRAGAGADRRSTPSASA